MEKGKRKRVWNAVYNPDPCNVHSWARHKMYYVKRAAYVALKNKNRKAVLYGLQLQHSTFNNDKSEKRIRLSSCT